MIVSPTPTTRSTRLFRARRVAGFVIPPALLALVVTLGFAGPRQDPAPVRNPGPPPEASDPGPAPDPASAFPAMFGDLEAIGPAELLAAGDALPPADAVALEGYLGVDAAESACADAPGAPFGSWCDRRGIIAETPWATSGTSAFPPHVRVHIPVGVRLPAVIEGAQPGDTLEPVPVLVVGRRAIRPAACQGWGPAICDDEFVMDRVAWAGGLLLGLTPLVDPRLQTEKRPNPFRTSLDLADMPLLGALVWPEDVWRLDSDAGSVAIDGTPGQPVWYLRVLDGARGPGMDRMVRWMLLAEPDLRVLANGRPDGEAGTTGGDGG